jgi:hypothetical protein
VTRIYIAPPTIASRPPMAISAIMEGGAELDERLPRT